MKTAILVFILIVIAVAIFHFGIMVGAWASARKLVDATTKALDESDLTSLQKLELINKIEKEAKK